MCVTYGEGGLSRREQLVGYFCSVAYCLVVVGQIHKFRDDYKTLPNHYCMVYVPPSMPLMAFSHHCNTNEVN